jgi:hypothetical protein
MSIRVPFPTPLGPQKTTGRKHSLLVLAAVIIGVSWDDDTKPMIVMVCRRDERVCHTYDYHGHYSYSKKTLSPF